MEFPTPKSWTKALMFGTMLSGLGSAVTCLAGWPSPIGPKTRDGDTVVSAWSETSSIDHYLVGGTSNSLALTENEACTKKKSGCAFLVTWNKLTQVYDQKWIFTEVQDIVDIVFDTKPQSDGSYDFAIIFRADNEYDLTAFHKVVTINSWLSIKAELSSMAYKLNILDDKSLTEEIGQ